MRALSVIAAPKAAYLVTSTLLAHKHKDLLDFTLPQLHITGHAQPARRPGWPMLELGPGPRQVALVTPKP